MIDNELNKKHFNSPEPGDYWSEMMCPYFMVLKVFSDKDSLIVCDDRKQIDLHHWTWDLTKAKEVPRSYMNQVLYLYGKISGFVADVTPHRMIEYVQEWEESGSEYVPLSHSKTKPASFLEVMSQGV